MKVEPVSAQDAPDNVKRLYADLVKSLGAGTLPLFFNYLGAFPEYLEYITDQLVKNLNDDQFLKICHETRVILESDIHKSLVKSEKVRDWLTRYKHSPQFYNFQENLSLIGMTNIKLAYVFISLREAVKGWAVAAKKLPSATAAPHPSDIHKSVETEDFVFENLIPPDTKSPSARLFEPSQGLIKHEASGIEHDLLGEYIFLTQLDFNEHMNAYTYWELRIRQEKYILSLLAVLPNLIFSPYNVIVPLTKKYDNFPALLHLLSEHFPTYAMQRMIFSGYMKDI